jgi:PncC family amidohydrolase
MTEPGTDSLARAAAEAGMALIESGRTLALAESCTGGLVSAALVSVPGISAVYRGGVVAYADEAKCELAGVRTDLIDRHGSVSEEVAMALAEGVAARLDAEIGAAVTGVAGPSGGTPQKPIGTVWVAVTSGLSCRARLLDLGGLKDRGQIRVASAEALLSLVAETVRP